jgi:RHS repeat-associated protein
VAWNGHGDALSLLRITADGTTELANSVTYSTWGLPTVDGSHDNRANGGADYGDLGFRYLYVGEFDVQWDNAFGLGLHYMHARHYAPALGRFLQPDPDGLEDSLYAYAANSPVTEIDPDGTCFIVCAVVGAAISVAVYAATTDSFDLGHAAGEALVGAVAGATGIGLVAKAASLARAVSTSARVTSTAIRASAPAVRNAISHASRAIAPPRLAVAAARGSRGVPPRWTPPTRPPKWTPPVVRPVPMRPVDIGRTLPGPNNPLPMRPPAFCRPGLPRAACLIGAGIVVSAYVAHNMRPQRR